MPQQNTILFSEIKFEISQVYEFSILALMLKTENSKILSRLVAVLLEEGGSFRGFRVFEFNPYAEIKNSENFSKCFQGL